MQVIESKNGQQQPSINKYLSHVAFADTHLPWLHWTLELESDKTLINALLCYSRWAAGLDGYAVFAWKFSLAVRKWLMMTTCTLVRCAFADGFLIGFRWILQFDKIVMVYFKYYAADHQLILTAMISAWRLLYLLCNWHFKIMICIRCDINMSQTFILLL